MYAITPLDPARAPDFESLAPFEVRHVLYGLVAQPRAHAFGATLMGRPIGLALAVEHDDALGDAGERARIAPTARLLSLTVARAYRRTGVGRALLGAIERALAARGERTLSCAYAIPSVEGRTAAEALARSAGWSPPEVTMVQCRAEKALLDAPLMREQRVLPPEYEICDWVDLSTDERRSIVERQEREPWFPVDLDPFHYEAELSVPTSLALRYRGEVVGWLLTHPVSRTAVQYRCLFVRRDLALLGRGLAMLCEAIQRHWELIKPQYGYGEWSTPSSLPAMIRFIRRHLEPFGAKVTEQRLVRTTLADSAPNSHTNEALADPAPNSHTSEARTARTALARACATPREWTGAPLFDVAEARELAARVRGLRERWIVRDEAFPFRTLGALAEVDSVAGVGAYHERAARENALLREHFSSLYERLRRALSEMLGGPTEYRDGWALPGFRIIESFRGVTLPIAPIRCELDQYFIEPGAAYDAAPVSFSTLLHATSGAHAGMRFWSMSHAQSIGLDTEELARLRDQSTVTTHAQTAGTLCVFGSEQFHQITPFETAGADEYRVLLEGRAISIGGMWQLFW